MVRNEIKNFIEKAIEKLQEEGVFPVFDMPEIVIEHPQEKLYGDYSTNAAFQIAKLTGKNLLEVADKLTTKFGGIAPLLFGQGTYRYSIHVNAGFINISIPDVYLEEKIIEILKQKDEYGDLEIGKKQKVNIEFISANPTGPLTLGNGRGGFCGDVLANVLEKAGYKVEREYYINDAGVQIQKLEHSIRKDELASYKGKYIDDYTYLIKKYPDIDKIYSVGTAAANDILETKIRPTVTKMGIKFDVWFSEKTLQKEVTKVIEWLRKKDLTYEKEGALWFKTTEFGDDKDRVLIKADGEKTYLASDIAYLKNKFDRGFGKLVFYWGADHYGYINRIKAAAVALGYKKEQIEVIIMQLVRLIQDGQEVKMSKRSGIYVTMDELLEEAGLDAARFFFLMRGADSHLNFDMDLAKEQSDKNPVYYVQYAHARICSILDKASGLKKTEREQKDLSAPAESELAKKLISFPEIIEDTARDYQLQRIPQYATDLAMAFHHFYQDCRVISEDNIVDKSRLDLISAVKIILENTLKLMGISAPEKM
jgi:arginyl-tRNA synthetase